MEEQADAAGGLTGAGVHAEPETPAIAGVPRKPADSRRLMREALKQIIGTFIGVLIAMWLLKKTIYLGFLGGAILVAAWIMS